MAADKRNHVNHLLPLIIFLSGFASLIYQVVWIRQFSLLFGTHLLSTSTVLTVFMAGLSLGALLFGKLADRIVQPVWLLFLIQAGIAVFAFLFQPLFQFITNLYTSINQSGLWLSAETNLSRILLSAMILIVPTTLMGGTLPVMVKLYTRKLGHLGDRAASLYSLNNAGAFAGGLLSGFFLLRLLGAHNTNILAASVNVVNALAVISIAILIPRTITRVTKNDAPTAPVMQYWVNRKVRNTVLVITAIEGFTMLVYEILWTRTVLEFSYDKSSYVYTVVILGFLFGMSVGSFVSHKKIDTWKNPVGKFALLEFAVGLTAWLTFLLFSYLSPRFFNERLTSGTWFHVSGLEYLFFFVLTSIPAVFMGISYPLVGKIITGNIRRVGSRMGLLSFADTIGSVAGPVVAGFIMLRFLDVYQSFLICVALNAGSGIYLAVSGKSGNIIRHRLIPASGAVLLLATALIFSRPVYYQNKAKLYPGEKIIAMEEGVTATVAISELHSTYMALSINGAKTAFTNPEDQRVHKMLAYLPWFFNPEAENAAVIGFGLGITTRCLAELNIHTTVAELSPEVLSLSSKYLGYANHGVAFSDYVRISVEDGRSVLLRSRQKFDIITTNAVHPRLGANLYSSDFYRLCKNRLAEHGTICQWIPTNWMSEDEFKSLIHSFTSVFPNARLWYVNRSHTLLVGSYSKLDINYEKFRSLFFRPEIFNEMTDIDLFSPETVLAGFFMSARDLNAWASDVPPDTDDKPVIEYSFETDPRPNQIVLRHLINSNPEFSEFIRFNDEKDEQEKALIIGRINQDYEENINYLKNLCRSLAAEDSLRN